MSKALGGCMGIDGQIDYIRYTREELLEVLDHIDAVRFPKNFENARLELAKRPITLPSPSLNLAMMSPRERAEGALKLKISWSVVAWFTVFSITATFMVEMVARFTFAPAGLEGAWSLAPAFLINVTLACLYPRGYYVNATLMTLIAAAFWSVFALAPDRAALTPVTVKVIAGSLFWLLCTVSVAGLVCGLWPHSQNTEPRPGGTDA